MTQMKRHPPRVYLASKLHRAFMWRNWKAELSPATINIVSTWHDSFTLDQDELDPLKCYKGWHNNRRELGRAQHLLVFGSKSDALNGTLIEIGMATALSIPIHLVGSYPWGTWRHLPFVTRHQSLHHALGEIAGTIPLHLPTNMELMNDPD